jgi:PAS domain S-box-containing protein
MTAAFRTIHVEDSDLQAVLVEKLLKKAFQNEDFIYVRAKRLQEALGQLDQGCLDVVVVDLGLPDAEGTDAVEAIRRVCPEAPILVLTGEEALSVGKACVRAGADYYLTKTEIRSLPLAIISAVERWELRRERKAVEDRYASIVEESPDWIVRFSPTGVITFANRAVLKAYDTTLDDISGRSLYSLMDADQMAGHVEVVAKLTPLAQHVDGNDLWLAGRLIHWRKSGIFDKAGRLVEVQAIGRDITAEHEMLQQLRRDAGKLVTKVTDRSNEMLDKAVAKLKDTLKSMESH